MDRSEVLSHSIRLPTIAIHADKGIEQGIYDVAPPLHVSSTFYLTDLEKGNDAQLCYSREDQITRRRVEAVLGALEGGNAIVYSSGISCIWALLIAFKPDIVALDLGYHSSKEAVLLYARDNSFVKVCNLSEFCNEPLCKESVEVDTKNGCPSRTNLVFVETPKNPNCQLVDIRQTANIVHQRGALLIVDGTFGSPFSQRPLELGADFVLHSTTKYLGGHSDLLGGVLISKTLEAKERLHHQRSLLGSIMGNLESFLLLRSLRTLSLRVKRQSRTACKIAKFLKEHSELVLSVSHPSLPSHMHFELCQRQMMLYPACFSFEMKTKELAQSLPFKLNLFIVATSLGGVESLIDYRYRYDPNVSERLLRISIGLESAKDLIADLAQAFDQLSLNK